MLASGKGYDIYGLTLAASTMVPLQGFWNMCVYVKPRYFSAKGREELRECIRSVTRRIFSIRLQTSSKDAPPADSNPNTTPTEGSNPTIKSSMESNSLIPMETEVVPFGAPDTANEHDGMPNDVLSAMDEPETISFDAPNPIDELDIDPNPPNTPDDETRQSRIRLTSMVLPSLFTKMDKKTESKTNNGATDAGLADQSEPNNDQQDVTGNEYDDEMYEMLLAG
jgi:hypothetical protein